MDTLKRLALPLIVLAFALGIGVGLFLGWQVWPVTWHDTDPSDLRQAHQATWIITAADSLAVTGDSQLARQRLWELIEDQSDVQQLANDVEQVAASLDQSEDKAAALRVRRLATAAGLPLAMATPVPAPTPGRSVLAKISNNLVLIGALIIFLAAAAIVIWAIMRLFRGRRQTSAEEEWLDVAEREGVDPTVIPQQERRIPGRTESLADRDVDLEGGRSAAYDAPPMRPVAYSSLDEDDLDQEVEEEIALDEMEADEEAELDEDWESPEESPTLVPEAPYEAEGDDLPPDALGVFQAEYHLGDDDFDCSFSIESEDGDFMGECGIGISDVLDVDGAQQVNAFEVWLFDKGDIRTVSKVLVSDYTYENEALNARLSAKGDLVVAQTGSSFTLETLALQVTVTITDVAYVPDASRPDAVFAQLNVEMLVEKAN
jgi:hypothetical protein